MTSPADPGEHLNTTDTKTEHVFPDGRVMRIGERWQRTISRSINGRTATTVDSGPVTGLASYGIQLGRYDGTWLHYAPSSADGTSTYTWERLDEPAKPVTMTPDEVHKFSHEIEKVTLSSARTNSLRRTAINAFDANLPVAAQVAIDELVKIGAEVGVHPPRPRGEGWKWATNANGELFGLTHGNDVSSPYWTCLTDPFVTRHWRSLADMEQAVGTVQRLVVAQEETSDG